MGDGSADAVGMGVLLVIVNATVALVIALTVVAGTFDPVVALVLAGPLLVFDLVCWRPSREPLGRC